MTAEGPFEGDPQLEATFLVFLKLCPYMTLSFIIPLVSVGSHSHLPYLLFLLDTALLHSHFPFKSFQTSTLASLSLSQRERPERIKP